MPLTFAEAMALVGLGVLALALTYCLQWIFAGEFAQRYAAALAIGAAYCAGFVWLNSWAELFPKRHWHWTFYLAAGAAVLGPIAASGGLRRVESWILTLAATAASAWFLVPNYPDLQPAWPILVLLLTAYLFLLAALLAPLEKRASPPTLLALMAASALCVAGVIIAQISVTYGKPACAAGAGLAGCALGARLARGLANGAKVQGFSLLYAVLAGGWAFIGYVEPRTPLWSLLIAPAAPLALWCCVWGPLSRLRGLGATAVQAAVVLVVLAIAAALAL